MDKKEEMGKEELEETVEQDIIEEDELKDEPSEEVNNKDQEVEELTNRLLRLQADFVNYKNRIEKDKEKMYDYATEEIIKQLLPILDNFDRALENGNKEDSFYQGIKMIYDQVLKVLNENGLKEIECLGEIFDPNFHHAVFAEESKDKAEGTILEVLQKGYLLNDRVIRPSMVKVAK